MGMKKFLAGMLVCVCAWGATPAFSDFNTTQFDVTGNKVAVKSGVMITNVSATVITNLDLTVHRFVISGAGKKQVDQGASSWLSDTLTDEAGDGAVVFSNGASVTNMTLNNPTFIGGNGGGGFGSTNANWFDSDEGTMQYYHTPGAGITVSLGQWATSLTGGSGTLVAGTATNMGYQAFATDANSNRSIFLYQGTAAYSSAWRLQFLTKFQIPDVTSNSVFYGFSAASSGTETGTTNNVSDKIGLYYNTLLGHSTYQLVSADGTTQTTISSGITPTNGLQMLLWMQGDTTGTNWDFWINRSYIGRVTNTTPRTTVLLRPIISLSNLTPASRTNRVYFLNFRAPGPVGQ